MPSRHIHNMRANFRLILRTPISWRNTDWLVLLPWSSSVTFVKEPCLESWRGSRLVCQSSHPRANDRTGKISIRSRGGHSTTGNRIHCPLCMPSDRPSWPEAIRKRFTSSGSSSANSPSNHQRFSPNAMLAFLTACQTVMGDKTPDEVIHPDSALLFIRFQGGVGPMWWIDWVSYRNSVWLSSETYLTDGPRVAYTFYEYRFKETSLEKIETFWPDTARAHEHFTC